MAARRGGKRKHATQADGDHYPHGVYIHIILKPMVVTIPMVCLHLTSQHGTGPGEALGGQRRWAGTDAASRGAAGPAGGLLLVGDIVGAALRMPHVVMAAASSRKSTHKARADVMNTVLVRPYTRCRDVRNRLAAIIEASALIRRRL